jgi:hypothetical protein
LDKREEGLNWSNKNVIDNKGKWRERGKEMPNVWDNWKVWFNGYADHLESQGDNEEASAIKDLVKYVDDVSAYEASNPVPEDWGLLEKLLFYFAIGTVLAVK